MDSRADLNSSHDSRDSASQTEHSVCGELIGLVRNISGRPEANSPEAAERAKSNQSLAEIAADTAAMIPEFRFFGAGAVRAALLIDPTKGFADNASAFAKNFAEGMALHGVSKLGGKITSAELLGGSSAVERIASESFGMFSYGFGMGAVKSAFNSESWKDANGNISFDSAVEHASAAGMTGGLIGVPGGLIGSRVAAAGIFKAGQLGWSNKLISVISGAGSGYSAGAVSGGVDAYMHGGSLKDVLVGANEGGLVGLATGGLTGAFMRAPIDLRGTARGTEIPRAGIADPAKIMSPGNPGESAFDRYTIFDPKHTIDESVAKLGSYTRAKATMPKLREDWEHRILDVGPKDYDLFYRRAIGATVEDVRVYKVGPTKLIVPENYAQKLDAVLEMRRQADVRTQPDAALREAAQLRLRTMAFADRAHPADMVWYFEQTPDPTLAKTIAFVDWQRPQDPFVRMTHGKDFVAAASASDDGTVTYWKTKGTQPFLQEIAHHEWSHLLKFTAKRESALFDDAALLEKNGFYTSDYSKFDDHENWAEHFSTLTQPDPTELFNTIDGAPVRSYVLAKAMNKALLNVPDEYWTPYHDGLLDRANMIENRTLPRAQELATDVLLSTRAPLEERVAASRVLREIGDDSHLEILKNLAKTSNTLELRSAAYDAAWQKAFYGNQQEHGYNGYKSPDTTDAQIKFLVEMAQNGSRSRDTALDHLNTMNNPTADAYHDLLTIDRVPHGKLGKLMKLMRTIPDSEGKQMAWDKAVSLVGNDVDERVNLAGLVVGRVPELRSVALDMLVANPQVRSISVLEQVAKSSNPEWAERAKLGLDRIRLMKQVDKWTQALTSSDVQKRIEAIGELGKSKEIAAVETLIKRAISGSVEEQNAAYEALSDNFSMPTIKHFARHLIQQDPRWRPSVQHILNAHDLNSFIADESYLAYAGVGV